MFFFPDEDGDEVVIDSDIRESDFREIPDSTIIVDVPEEYEDYEDEIIKSSNSKDFSEGLNKVQNLLDNSEYKSNKVSDINNSDIDSEDVGKLQNILKELKMKNKEILNKNKELYNENSKLKDILKENENKYLIGGKIEFKINEKEKTNKYVFDSKKGVNYSNFSFSIHNERIKMNEEFCLYFEKFKDNENNYKRNKLKKSNIFYGLYNVKKEENNKTEFINKTLKVLFEEGWINKIEKNIIKKLFKTIIKLNEKQIENELNILKEYFEINIIDNSFISKLKDEIIIFSKKEEINDIIDNFINAFREKEINNNISNSMKNFRDNLLLIKDILESKENRFEELKLKNKELIDAKINIKNYKDNLENQFKKLYKVNYELSLEKESNKIYQTKINELSKSLNGGKEKFQILFDKLNKEIKEFNNTSNSINEFQLNKEIEKRNKKIDELKLKLSRYPYELAEGEEIITVIFSPIDESNILSILCKNTDKFSEIENKLYESYPEYKVNNIFMINGRVIDKNDNLIENGINNKSIIYFNKNA